MSVAQPPFRPKQGATRAEVRDWHDWMVRWLEEQLDQQHIHNITVASELGTTLEELCIAAARKGDLVPLKRLYPQLADFIQSPKELRKQKDPVRKAEPLAKVAADFARRIRGIWQYHHGQKNRRRDEPSAEEFALAICKRWFRTSLLPTVDDVLAANKPSGKHVGRRKKSRVK